MHSLYLFVRSCFLFFCNLFTFTLYLPFLFLSVFSNLFLFLLVFCLFLQMFRSMDSLSLFLDIRTVDLAQLGDLFSNAPEKDADLEQVS